MHVHLRRIKLEGVAALLLGPVHRDIGVFEQCLHIPAIIRESTDADAGRHVVFAAREREAGSQRLNQFARQAANKHRIGHIFNQHHKLVATESRHRVGRAQLSLQARRHFAQQNITGLMAQRVVDDLETVEVDEQYGQPAATALRQRQRVLQPLVEHHAIGQFGQPIVAGHKLQRLLCFPPPHVLANLTAYRARRADQRLFRLATATVIKLHHPHHFAAAQQRKSKSPAQSRTPDQVGTLETLRRPDIGDPDRFAGQISAAEQTLLFSGLRFDCTLHAVRHELLQLRRIRSP